MANKPAEFALEPFENAISTSRREVTAITIIHVVAVERFADDRVAEQTDRIDVADAGEARARRFEHGDRACSLPLNIRAGPSATFPALLVAIAEYDALEAGLLERWYRPDEQNAGPGRIKLADEGDQVLLSCRQFVGPGRVDNREWHGGR